MSSSALTNLVPVLNGENSVLWFQQMTAYLMSSGEWDIIEDYLELTVIDVFSHVVDVPAVMSPGGQHVSTAATTRTQNDLCIVTNDSYLRLSEDYVEHLKSTAEWKAKDSKVRGHILLRCSTAIQKKIKNEDCAFDMWKVLQGDYAVVGTSGIYNVVDLLLRSVRSNPTKGRSQGSRVFLFPSELTCRSSGFAVGLCTYMLSVRSVATIWAYNQY